MKQEVFLADDHQLFIDGIITLIKEMEGFSVSGFANNGAEALRQILLLNPQIVLLDIDMPKINGLLVLEKLRKQGFLGKILMLSQFDELSVIEKAEKSGANGYLLKSSEKEQFIEVIQRIANGESYFTTEKKIPADKPLKREITAIWELTEREREIIQLIANGFSNKEIAEKLFISHKTVDVHRTNLMKKLQVNNVASLVKLSFEMGLIE